MDYKPFQEANEFIHMSVALICVDFIIVLGIRPYFESLFGDNADIAEQESMRIYLYS